MTTAKDRGDSEGKKEEGEREEIQLRNFYRCKVWSRIRNEWLKAGDSIAICPSCHWLKRNDHFILTTTPFIINKGAAPSLLALEPPPAPTLL